MRTFLECVPCMVRQAYEAVNMATSDRTVQEELLRGILRELAGMRLDLSPPHMGALIHRRIRERTGVADPYRAVKLEADRAAMRLYPRMREMVRSAVDPFALAVRLAIAGNVIDFGAPGRPDNATLPNVGEAAAARPLHGRSPGELEAAVRAARSILVLGDNAGEVVFDRLLLERMPLERVTYAVKGSPVLNDATMEDAREAGLTELVEVIDNGSDAPGTVLEWCSPEFARRFGQAELVIAKGQGNYETLSTVRRGRRGAAGSGLFFLLKAKCPVVARDLGCGAGDFVLHRND